MPPKPHSRLVASEPYRIFFPLALIYGVIGVMLWPAFYWDLTPHYPYLAHPRLMLEGFVAGFAIGFLGTALPKMFVVPHFRLWQVVALLILQAAAVVCHLVNYSRVGDGFFATTLGFFIVLVLSRVAKRKSLPPATMILTPMGVISGLLGSLWYAVNGYTGDPSLSLFSQRLLYQVFILLPLLGVGAFFFPMVLGTEKPPSTVSETVKKQIWRRKAFESAFVGVLVILTYWAEVRGQFEQMAWARFIVILVWFTRETGWLRFAVGKGIMSLSLRLGILCILIGSLSAVIDLTQKVALDHSLYIGGFGLVSLTVATRVIYGHSGQGSEFQKWGKLLTAASLLMVLTAATRVSADFIVDSRIYHHIYAAFLWLIVSIIWAFVVFPSLSKRPPAAAKRKFPPLDPASKPTPSLMDIDLRRK